MTQEQEQHLQSIKDWFTTEVDKKYRAGQKEHGGDLWLKSGIIDMAIEEVLDMAVYLTTLKSQIAQIQTKFDEAYDLKDGENLSNQN